MFMYVKGFSAKSSPSLDVADASKLKMSEIFWGFTFKLGKGSLLVPHQYFHQLQGIQPV